jgi:hypothetical protein
VAHAAQHRSIEKAAKAFGSDGACALPKRAACRMRKSSGRGLSSIKSYGLITSELHNQTFRDNTASVKRFTDHLITVVESVHNCFH